jgi:hypothetical protein
MLAYMRDHNPELFGFLKVSETINVLSLLKRQFVFKRIERIDCLKNINVSDEKLKIDIPFF